ncbi:MAG: hypothetical protein HOW73_43505 [Polyangiaceae bacterium]|nr:hypothetical protein [Polyangiaceae bacterium]
MDNDTKRFLGKILGELYRIQSKVGVEHGLGEHTIYGLLKGFESVIDEELERVGWVSRQEQRAAETILAVHWNDPDKLAEFNGFYTIEDELKRSAVDRTTAIRILTFHQANGSFAEIIGKMNSSGSPVECKTFELERWEK